MHLHQFLKHIISPFFHCILFIKEWLFPIHNSPVEYWNSNYDRLSLHYSQVKSWNTHFLIAMKLDPDHILDSLRTRYVVDSNHWPAILLYDPTQANTYGCSHQQPQLRYISPKLFWVVEILIMQYIYPTMLFCLTELLVEKESLQSQKLMGTKYLEYEGIVRTENITKMVYEKKKKNV